MSTSPDRPRGRLVVVAGPSGVGKTSVVRRLLSDRRNFSVSATTRPPRPGERDGIDYHFVTEDEFDRLIAAGELLEWATYGGYRYGTLRRQVVEELDRGHDVLLDIETAGARQIRASFPGSLLVFLTAPTWDELERRLVNRRDTPPEQIHLRLDIARRELSEAPAVFDVIIVNRDIEVTARRVEALIPT